ncbi:carbonate dehydratase [Hyphomicrobium sp.]|uniref:carbonate dehydratase n=1 Tax=Hyphomicrobium sp. TaxID=82 RepID=UPI002E350A97|nr:carbonate dehydratase [Hyphomicrobium sp.]HEX2841414.1 carbonate dehydratase [Hyphomicrobium sp.]
MAELARLFEKNRAWASAQVAADPLYFSRLAQGQAPKYLWIGCSDSRVPANQILDLAPGDVFVHRNVANLVVHTDMSCLSVIQFAVEVLKIEHIIVCGHYSCGGVHAACGSKQYGLIDNWLRNIKDIYRMYKAELDSIEDQHGRADRLCELNVIEQVKNVCHTTIVQNAWASGRPLSVHGVVYSLEDGLLRDLAVRVNTPGALEDIYRTDSYRSTHIPSTALANGSSHAG